MTAIGRHGITRLVGLMLLGMTLSFAPAAYAGETSTEFSGHHVNSGTATHDVIAGKHVLTLSKDFPKKVDAPDPHWQVVDSRGMVYLLDRLNVKDDTVKTSITLPAYIPDIAKVQFWCAFVEVVLGEASFARPVAVHASR